MTQLWYDDDEVRKFHPLVEECLTQIIVENGLDSEYAVEHHPIIPGSTKTPDFSIYKKRTRRIFFILEVKRTERDVDSQRYWNQARGYVRDLTHDWEPGHKYFAITNIEKTISFAERTGPDTSCVLADNPLLAGKFDPETHEAGVVTAKFKALLTPLIMSALSRRAPQWADAWRPIVSSFTVNLRSTIDALTQGRDDVFGKEVGTYELLRIFLYHFISSYYGYTKSPNVKYFRLNRLNPNPALAFQEAKNNYARALELDFKQIFSESPDVDTRITEEQFRRILSYFNSFVETLQNHITSAVMQNHSPEYFFNLLTENLYAHKELHKEGKVMSDSELAGLLAELCIDKESLTILDPGCGDGALLGAAYDRLYQLRPSLTHQEILDRVHGMEIDPFLTQLAAFRLLMKNAHDVDEDTEAKIEVADIFKRPVRSQYDVVVMNPPFLRNEESRKLVGSSTDEIVAAIQDAGEDAFVARASQPNLYFYFVNYAIHYLNDEGVMGAILMSKFMNNKDALYLKDFMKDKVEAVIAYPKNYFQQFKVTTSIVILRKGTGCDLVKFLNLRTDALLNEPERIRSILESTTTEIMPGYSLKVVPRSTLDPGSNWRTYLLDPEDKFEKIKDFPGFVSLTSLFGSFKRGIAGNSEKGASDLVFPSLSSEILGLGKVPSELFCNGMRLNKLASGDRHYILTHDDFVEQRAIDFPMRYSDTHSFGYDPIIQNEFLGELYKEASQKYRNWKRILNEAVASKVRAQIVIPRADRTKHVVFYNATGQSIVLSTNFFALTDFNNNTESISERTQIKFITAFLLSAFGQLQFELLGNDHEGMRKLEGFMISQFKVPDPLEVSEQDILSVVAEFDSLNADSVVFSGAEGINTPRMGLDLAIAQTLINMGVPGFDNKERLASYVQLFLADLVGERIS